MQLKVGVTLGMRQQILIPIKAYCSKLPNGEKIARVHFTIMIT